MERSSGKEIDSVKAKQMWMRYRKRHDLSGRAGQTVGIDPEEGKLWFGESIRDIVLQRDVQGLKSPLFFERVGSRTYISKGRTG